MLRLRSIDPDQNRWGRIGTEGQEKLYHFSNQDEALRKIRQLGRRHGYELTEGGVLLCS